MLNPLGQRLRAARKSMHPPVTQREVAKRVGVTASAVCLWERGRTEPSADALSELARWFGTSTDWLLGVDTAPTQTKRSPRPPVFTVPVVPASQLARFHWENVTELLQTAVAYPPGTAAAMRVPNDSLQSTCPAGAWAVVSSAHPVAPGCVVLAMVSKVGDPVLRRLISDGGDALLVADDMRYPTHRLAQGVKVIGRVTEVCVRRSML